MGKVREYYDTDAKALNAQSEWQFNSAQNNTINILGKISYVFEQYSKYWSFYIPENVAIDIAFAILSMPNVVKCIISEDEPQQIVGFADSPERVNLFDSVFTGRVYLYIDAVVSNSEKKAIEDFGNQRKLNVVIRDIIYVAECEKLCKPVAFISHDSRDKDELVRDLAMQLSIRLRKVWYDEFSLKAGDSLRENIENGLKQCEKCIIVLSPNFIANSGWTKTEFDSIFTRELVKNESVFIPIWHNVTKDQVFEYCPKLVDRLALHSSKGAQALAEELATQLNS